MVAYSPDIAGKWFAKDRELEKFIEEMNLSEAERYVKSALKYKSKVESETEPEREKLSKIAGIPVSDLNRFIKWVDTIPKPLRPWAYVLFIYFRDVDRIMDAYIPLQRVV